MAQAVLVPIFIKSKMLLTGVERLAKIRVRNFIFTVKAEKFNGGIVMGMIPTHPRVEPVTSNTLFSHAGVESGQTCCCVAQEVDRNGKIIWSRTIELVEIQK